jgi:hypothetical protein
VGKQVLIEDGKIDVEIDWREMVMKRCVGLRTAGAGKAGETEINMTATRILYTCGVNNSAKVIIFAVRVSSRGILGYVEPLRDRICPGVRDRAQSALKAA